MSKSDVVTIPLEAFYLALASISLTIPTEPQVRMAQVGDTLRNAD